MSEWRLEADDLHNENKYRIKSRKGPVTILLLPDPQRLPMKTTQSSFPDLSLYINILNVGKNCSPHTTVREISHLFSIPKLM